MNLQLKFRYIHGTYYGIHAWLYHSYIATYVRMLLQIYNNMFLRCHIRI